MLGELSLATLIRTVLRVTALPDKENREGPAVLVRGQGQIPF